MSGSVLQISSGTGPVEVRKFVARLSECLERELLQQNMRVIGRVEIGDAAAPRTVRLLLADCGDCLRSLAGTYVLVAPSVARGSNSRKRWFAGVEVFSSDLDWARQRVDEADVVFQACRAGGPGGQHVNKTSSAIRATHLPSGVTVRVSQHRNQLANKKEALTLIGKALDESHRQNLAQRDRFQRLHHRSFERGGALRSFRLDRRGRLVEVRR